MDLVTFDALQVASLVSAAILVVIASFIFSGSIFEGNVSQWWEFLRGIFFSFAVLLVFGIVFSLFLFFFPSGSIAIMMAVLAVSYSVALIFVLKRKEPRD